MRDTVYVSAYIYIYRYIHACPHYSFIKEVFNELPVWHPINERCTNTRCLLTREVPPLVCLVPSSEREYKSIRNEHIKPSQDDKPVVGASIVGEEHSVVCLPLGRFCLCFALQLRSLISSVGRRFLRRQAEVAHQKKSSLLWWQKDTYFAFSHHSKLF